MCKTAVVIFILACTAVLACNQHTTAENNTSAAKDSIEHEPGDTSAAVPGMPGYIYLQIQEGLPVREQNFIDTFSVNGQRFRFVYTYSEDDYNNNAKLQQLYGDTWRQLFALDYLSGRSTYSRSEDVNGDGYPDFQDYWRYGSRTYLYKPAENTFDTAISVELYDWQLLDTARNIYCQNRNIVGHQEESILYTFDGIKQVILYTVDFDKEDDGSPATLKALNLYKTVPGFKDSSILVSKTPLDKELTDFDYVPYWRKSYKKLLGLK